MPDSKELLIHSVPYLAEFLGTFTLVFAAGWTALVQAQAIWALTAYAFLLTAMVYSLEPVSGAHMNPAVTLCAVLAGRTDKKHLAGYWLVQFAGAACAGKVCNMLLPVQPWTGLYKPVFWGHYAGAEALYTCMLCFVIMNVACEKANAGNEFYGLAIGFVYVAGGYAVLMISGAAFNPATNVGFDITLWNGSFSHSIGYGFWEFVGAALAALLFRLVRPEEFGGEGDRLITKCLGEFLGTFYLAITVGLNLLTRSGARAWSSAACLLCMTYALATVSGANFNPAVTLGLKLSGRKKMEGKTAAAYVTTQVIAGAMAGLALGMYVKLGDYPEESFRISTLEGVTPLVSLIVEFAFSGALVFVWLVVSSTKVETQFFFGLTIAFCFAAGAMAAGHISGGMLNPAVTLSIAIGAMVQQHVSWVRALYWIAAELVGGVCGSLLFRLMFRREYEESIVDKMLDLGENKKGSAMGSKVAGNENEERWKEKVWSFKERACTSCTFRN